MMNKAWRSIEEVPYCFSRSSIKFQGHTAKKIVDFDPNSVFPDCNLSFWFTDGFEMMHTARSNIEGVPYCLKKSQILTRIERFRTVTPVWIHRWIWNDEQSLA